eukprot:GILJ01009687.1.p1 GENE.GILJ01009687.1~~GILJ01009687.1.p1  ORF type:complete len:196 (-),score=27.25 GILJ01009687.1:123-668(-)
MAETDNPPSKRQKISMTIGQKTSNINQQAKLQAVFADSDEDEVMPPPGAKFSRNVGIETPTADGPKSFGKTKQGFTAVSSLVTNDTKTHHLSRPREEKRSEDLVADVGTVPDRAAAIVPPVVPSSAQVSASIGPFICVLCQRKLPSEELLRKHFELSELHKQNVARQKAQEQSEGKTEPTL